jgi:phage shock protein PspC (stress-responsive transcriptional regulator)
MKDTNTGLIARDDTMLGICQGIAEDFGFDPVWLRVALSVSLFWSPALAFAAYGALGGVVLLSRLLFPNPRTAAAATVQARLGVAKASAPAPAPAREQDKVGRQLLPLAA